MNGDRFDSLTRVIGSVASRRAVARALAGATLGLAADRLDPRAAAEAAAAPPQERSRRCRQGKKRCDGRCVDTATNRTNGDDNDFSPAWSPDGKQIAFTTTRDGNAEVYTMSADGSGQTRRTENDAHDEEADWQPKRR